MTHNNSETRHSWKGHWTFYENQLLFSGIYCDCGAYIKADELAGLLSFYSGNDIMVSPIEDKIMHHNFDAKAYEDSIK